MQEPSCGSLYFLSPCFFLPFFLPSFHFSFLLLNSKYIHMVKNSKQHKMHIIKILLPTFYPLPDPGPK